MVNVAAPLKEGEWHLESITSSLFLAERLKRIIYTGRTVHQNVVVQDTEPFGRSLVLDNKTQSTELDEFIYHEALVHPCMISHPNPRRVFVAGGGEGATIREVFSHSTVDKTVMVDIDDKVVELCKQHLPSHHQGAFNDPRLTLLYQDAFQYLDLSLQTFDVAIIDVPDPLERGPAHMLYTQEFYKLVMSRLSHGGMMVAQAGPTGPTFYRQCFTDMAKTIGSVFPTVSVYETFVPSFGSTWGFVIGSLGPDPLTLSENDLNQRTDQRVSRELRHYDGTTHKGMLSIPKYLRRALETEGRIITRENPIFTS